ncbi:hypothetical protein BRADI_3g23373v3 [Brachypodium distachyon]|uniref:Uncharacterized protein n=1 Tax=Brachypodium distachyon TaxID=15368 RepID=A0A0Q3I7Q2_BRADI|nr:hypothetical protein BRADI_3g23373v3 [Brachypodium distachyon]
METRDHLFFQWPFSVACWRYICPGFAPRHNVHHNIMDLKDPLGFHFIWKSLHLLVEAFGEFAMTISSITSSLHYIDAGTSSKIVFSGNHREGEHPHLTILQGRIDNLVDHKPPANL